MSVVIGTDKNGNSHIHHYVRHDEKSMKCFMCGYVYVLTEEQMTCDHVQDINQLINMAFPVCSKCNKPLPFLNQR